MYTTTDVASTLKTWCETFQLFHTCLCPNFTGLFNWVLIQLMVAMVAMIGAQIWKVDCSGSTSQNKSSYLLDPLLLRHFLPIGNNSYLVNLANNFLDVDSRKAEHEGRALSNLRMINELGGRTSSLKTNCGGQNLNVANIHQRLPPSGFKRLGLSDFDCYDEANCVHVGPNGTHCAYDLTLKHDVYAVEHKSLLPWLVDLLSILFAKIRILNGCPRRSKFCYQFRMAFQPLTC